MSEINQELTSMNKIDVTMSISKDKKEINSKVSPLPKPDFSSIEKKESAFTYKQKGSYKKPKSNVPESPMKSPNQKFFTPVKLQEINLFGGNANTCRKLNFLDGADNKVTETETAFTDSFKTRGRSLLERLEEEDRNIPSNEISPSFMSKKDRQISTALFLEKQSMEMEVENEEQVNYFDIKMDEDGEDNNLFNNLHKIESKFEREFTILKTLDAGSFGIVYQCMSKNDNLIYAVKKSKKHSSVYDYNITNNLINDFQQFYIDEKIMSRFCVSYKDCWLEEESHNHTLTENHLYILQEYCMYGDLLDYLEKLEEIGFKLNEDFYWDLIFEMLCSVHHVHQCGYIHFDIKPNNFLIDETGCVKLGDFGLSRKFSEIKKGEDINEGDSTYLAPEFFGVKENIKMFDKKTITSKCDVFSLGLSILEILCKVELPQNGVLWKKIRSPNFEIPQEFLNNSNIKISENMINLINEMINITADLRPEVKNILENTAHQEINCRYKKLLSHNYDRVLNPKLFSTNKKEENSPLAKRSNSFQTSI